MDQALCDWLMDHADAPIRYRMARELLDDGKTAKKLEPELLDHPAVRLWLHNLKPQSPPQHRWMEHGSFDFCLENALLKAVQLGLHGGLPQVWDALDYYLAKMRPASRLEPTFQNFSIILTANLLSLAHVENDTVSRFMLTSLDEMYRFTQRNRYDYYLSEEERKTLTGVPACWKTGRPFIRPELLRDYGFSFPLLYDIAGMHALYRLKNPEIDRKIDGIIRYLSAGAFHRTVADGYGILVEGNGVYHAMGWDPKYPGWLDVAAYLQSGSVPQLLFYAQHACRYPVARETKWYAELLRCLDGYRTGGGRYAFPTDWLPEKQGYAVMGRHLSFGENRRKKNWREIESTFYMQMLEYHRQ